VSWVRLRQLVSTLLGRRLTVRLGSPFYQWRARQQTVRRLRSLPAGGLLVNLGCGYRPLAGWVNLDAAWGYADVVWDVRRDLPFRDGACRAILMEHLIEHLPREEGGRLVAECHRVLEPGGILRISTPDAEKFLRAYVTNDQFLFSPEFYEPVESPLDRINLMMREHGHHLWAYDETTLQRILERAGFEMVVRQACQESTVPELAGVDHPARAFESLYLEAQKRVGLDRGRPHRRGEAA
jgi:predicted SAM-dependent methyltransferase